MIGDIVTYRLSETESNKIQHVSGVNKYSAKRSFPCRVVEVSKGSLLVRHLWLRQEDRRVPRAECKRLVRYIPELMRVQAEKLFPNAPWLSKDGEAVKRSSLKRPSIEGLTWQQLERRIEAKSKGVRGFKRAKRVDEQQGGEAEDVTPRSPLGEV